MFEARLGQRLFDKSIKGINRTINEQEDSLSISIYYPMCAACQKGMVIMGKGPVVEDQDVRVL